MHECTYTTQKTKKNKKWCDGFVDKVGSLIKLYNENKVVISTSSYKINEEELIETPNYLIYVDDIELFSKSGEIILAESDVNELKDSNYHEASSMNVKKIKTEDSNTPIESNKTTHSKPSEFKSSFTTKKDSSKVYINNQQLLDEDLKDEDILELPKIEGRDFSDILDLFR